MKNPFYLIPILMLFLTGSLFTAKTQNLAISSFPVFMQTHLKQDIKTHLIYLKITTVNSSKIFSFKGKYGTCNISYVILQLQQQVATYPGKSTRLGKTVACPNVLLFMNLAPGERRIALEMQLQNRYFEALRLKPGQYQFKGSFLMGGQIGTQKVSKFPLGPVTFIVK